ncbi:hypothetical protein KC929_00240 [Patescibacteria group bacterium]|nr:hypothetical protein [Patescibacteria group bacterium]
MKSAKNLNIITALIFVVTVVAATFFRSAIESPNSFFFIVILLVMFGGVVYLLTVGLMNNQRKPLLGEKITILYLEDMGGGGSYVTYSFYKDGDRRIAHYIFSSSLTRDLAIGDEVELHEIKKSKETLFTKVNN